jgi:hypothetical protein
MSETTDGTTGKSPEELELEALERDIAAEDVKLRAVTNRRTLALKRLELEEKRREARDAAVVEQLVAQHGEVGISIATMSTPEALLAVKVPHRAALKRLRQNPKGPSIDDEDMFVRTCIIHPSADDFTRISQQRPGVVTTLANLALRLAGTKEVELGKE